MIKLRKLKEKDVLFMLEWMHDKDIAGQFQNDFLSYNKEKVISFIKNSYNEKNQHFAIVNEKDEYLGTISLKNIDIYNSNAEYAISTRKNTHGTGINSIATKLILKYAFETLQLKKVYLNVLSENKRAKNFYLKNGFTYEGTFKKHIMVSEELKDLEWYSIICD